MHNENSVLKDFKNLHLNLNIIIPVDSFARSLLVGILDLEN